MTVADPVVTCIADLAFKSAGPSPRTLPLPPFASVTSNRLSACARYFSLIHCKVLSYSEPLGSTICLDLLGLPS